MLVSVDDVLDDNVVEVECRSMYLVMWLVVVNPINVAVGIVECDGDVDDDGFTIEVVDELLIGNDDNEDDVDGVDDVVCEVIPVDVVIDGVKVVAFQAVADDNGDDDDAEGCALTHAKEKASAKDERKVVKEVVVNKDVEMSMSVKKS